MKNKVSSLTILTFTMLTSCVTTQNDSNFARSGSKISETEWKKQLNLLKENNTKLQEQNDKLKEDSDKIKKESDKIKEDNKNLKKDNDDLKDINNELDNKNKQLQKENEKLQEENKTNKALVDGNWKIINDDGVDVEKTGDALGFIYKFDSKEITNGKNLKDIEFKKDLQLTSGFEKLFEGLINNVGQANESLKETEVETVIDALNEFKNGKAINELSGDKQNIIKRLDGCSSGGNIKYDTTFGNNEAKRKLYDLILAYLSSKNLDKIKSIDKSAKKLKYEYKEKNELKQGKAAVKLKYSDFGSWTKSFDISNELRTYLNDPDLETKIKYFAIGADNYKVIFNPDKKFEKDLTFKGQTFATVTKGKDLKNLDGSATLYIKQGETTGKFDLNFENWYKFSLDKLKLNNFTEETDAKWQINGESTDSMFKFHDDATKKEVNNATIKGGFYGENQKPEEVAGTYKFKTNDDKGTEFDINGAFGAKKEK